MFLIGLFAWLYVAGLVTFLLVLLIAWAGWSGWEVFVMADIAVSIAFLALVWVALVPEQQ